MPAAGYELDRIAAEGISRSNPLKAARAGAKAVAALGTARSILARRQPDAVLGGGGYVAGPVGLVAALKRIPLRPHRGRLAPGHHQPRAGAPRPARLPRLPARGPRGRALPRDRPPRPADGHRPRRLPRASSASAADETCVLVFGGSLGARSINTASVKAFADAPYRVLHVAGKRDYAELEPPGAHYVLRDYLSPFGAALAASDLAVARSGGSVFELAQYGLPAVLIPYPHASADHQTTNARWMEEPGAATVLRDAELSAGAAARGGRRDRARSGPAAGDERRIPRAGAARRRAGHRRRGARGGRKKGGARRRGAAPLDLVRGSTDRWPGLPLVTAEPRTSFKGSPPESKRGDPPQAAVSSPRSRTRSSASVL